MILTIMKKKSGTLTEGKTMSKGYYKSFRINRDVIHGGSYAIHMDDIDFVTWKKNFETGEYWVKFHTASGKEIRLKVNHEGLNEILTSWGNSDVEYYEDKRNEDDMERN